MSYRLEEQETENNTLDIGSYSFVLKNDVKNGKSFDNIYHRAQVVFKKPQVRRKIKWAAVIILLLNIVGLSLTSYLVTKPKQSAAAPTQNGRLIYSNNTTTPQDRPYTAASNTFNSASAMQTGAAQSFMMDKAAPTRNEHIAGYVTTGGVLYIQRWNGTAWSAEWNVTVGGNGADGRRFSIAYEKTTGNAMVAYSLNVNGNAGAEMAYNIWNGSSWGGATSFANSALLTQAAPVTWIKMEANPTASSNEISLIAADTGIGASTALLTSFVWSGSAWTEAGSAFCSATYGYIANTATSLLQNDITDLAYESLTGDLIVIYTTAGGTTPNQYYRTKSAAGTWGTPTTFGSTARTIPLQMVAESNPNSDQIMIFWIRSNTTIAVYGNIWSGTAMGTLTTISTGTTPVTTVANKKHITGKWLRVGTTDYAVALWQTSTAGTFGRNYYTGTGWGTAATYASGAGASSNWMDSDADPFGTDTMMLTFSTGSAGTGSLWAKRLVLSSGPTFTWSNADGGTALTTALASATAQNFDFEYNKLPQPGAPTLYNDDGGTTQIAFNNSKQNDTTPVIRASAVSSIPFNYFQVEFNTTSTFSGTAYTEGFSGSYTTGTPANLQTTGTLGLPSTDGVTYYVRVRASTTGGSDYGPWSNGVSWSYTYTATAGDPTWFQTTDTQFNNDTLVSAAAASNSVGIDIQDGRIVYSNNGTTPQSRPYTGATNSFGAAASMQTGAAQTFMVNKASATRNEHIAGYVTSAGALYIQRWNGSAWSAEWGPITVGGNGVDGRRFDIAYEKTTGNAIVVYSTNATGTTGNEMAYRIWDGSTWASAVNINSAALNQAAAVTAIKLIPKQTASSNEIALMAQDTGTTTANTSQLTTLIWSGSSWGNEPSAAHSIVMTNTTGQLVANQAFDAAWESTSGHLLIVYRCSNATTPNYYRDYTGTWGTAASLGTARVLAGQIVAISDPQSDRVSIAYNTTTGVYGNSWSGTALGTQATISTGYNGQSAAVNKKSITGAYVVVGGTSYGLIFWHTATSGQLAYNRDTAGTWGTAAPYASGDASTSTNWMDTDTHPVDTNTIMLSWATGAAGTSSLWSKRLVVTAGPVFTWSNSDGGTALGTALGSITTQNFDFRFDRYAATGSVMSQEITYASQQGGTAWNTASFATTETNGDVKLKLYYKVTTACDTLIPNTALSGNESGFDVSAGSIDISGLSTTTYASICLSAEMTVSGGTPYLNDWTVAWTKGAATISITGTSNTTGTVAVAVNTTVQTGKTGTITGGNWSIDTVTKPSSGAVITVWITGAPESTAVTKYNGTGNETGLLLNAHVLSIGSASNQSLTVTNLGQYDYNDDTNIMHTANTGTLLVDAGSAFTDEALNILSGNTLTIGTSEVVTTVGVTIGGNLTSSGNSTYNVAGGWTNNGAFTQSTSTVNFNGAGTQTINGSATTTFNNLATANTANATTGVATNIGGTLVIGNGSTFTAAGYDLTVTGTTTVGGGTNGSLVISSATGTKTFTGLVTTGAGSTWNNSGNSAVTFRGGITNNATGTFTAGSGVHTFDTNAQALTGTLSIPNVTVTTVTLTNNNTLTVATALSGTGGLTQAASSALNLGGTSGITTLTATNTGNTVDYTGNGQTVHANNYYNLTLSGTGTKTLQAGTTAITGAFTLGGTAATTGVVGLTIGGNVTLGSGTAFTAGSFTHNVAGNWSNNGTTFTNTGSTVNFNGTGTQTINGSATTTFNNVTTANTANATTGVATNIAGTLVIGNGSTFTAAGFALTVTGTTTVGGGTNGSLVISSATGTKIFTGLVTTNAGSTWNNSGNSPVTFRGGITHGGTTFTAGSGVHTFDTNSQALTGTLTIPSITVTSPTVLTNNGTLTVATDLSGTGSFTNGNGTTGTLNYGATTLGVNIFTASAANNLVNYNGTAQTVRAVTPYHDLTFSTSGAKTLGTATTNIDGDLTFAGTASATGVVGLTIGGTVTLGSGTTFTPGAFTHNVAGNWTNNNTTFTNTGSTINFNGATPTINGTTTTTFNNVSTSGTGNTSTGVATNIAGTLVIGNGSTFTAAGFALTVTGTTTVGGGTNGSLVISSATGTKIFTGLVTTNAGSTWNNSGNSAVTFRGGITHGGTTFTAGSGVHTFDTNSQALTGTLVIPSIVVTSPTVLTNNGTLTVATDLSGTGSFTNGNGTTGTLNYGATTLGVNTFTASAANNLVNYNGTAQTVRAVTPYHDLTFSTSGAKTLGTATTNIDGDLTFAGTASATGVVGLTIGGTVTLGSGTTFTPGAFTHNVAGNWTNNGGTFTGTGSTINFNGSVLQTITGAHTWNNLTVTNTAGTPSDTVDVDPTVAQTVGGTLTIVDGQYSSNTGDSYVNVDIQTNGILKPDVSASVSVSGNWTNAGTFTHNSGTVNFNGAAVQAITGSNTWNNLTINNTAATPSDTADVDPTAAQTVAGTLTVTDGQYSANTGDSYNIVSIAAAGILKPDSGASVTVSGNWANAGTFTSNSGTVDFTLGSGTQTLNSGGVGTGKEFNNLTHSGAGTLQLLTNALDVSGAFNHTAGTFNCNSLNQFFGGNVSLSSGTVFTKGGTMTFDGTSQAITDSNTTKVDLGVVTIGPTTTTTLATNSSITVTSMTVGADDTLNITDDTLKLLGNGTPLTVNTGGTFTITNSTVNYAYQSTNSTINVATVQYNNVSFIEDVPVNTQTFVLTGNLTGSNAVLGNVIVGGGNILDATTNDYNMEVGGSWESNTGSANYFMPRNGTVTFNSATTGKTIYAIGNVTYPSFWNVVFNNSAGGWTIQTSNPYIANDLNITDVSDWTLQSGRTMTVVGTYSIADAETSATTWTGSTLYLNSGTAYTVGSKTQSAETYGTLQIGANTDIRLWNSSAATYTVDATGSLYSQDHAAVNGDLYIWGDYHTTGTDYWSYATDFDGTALSGTERQVDVRVDPSANVTVDATKTLNIIGAASANRTSVSRQGAANGYGIIVAGATINAQYTDFTYLDGNKGIDIQAGSTVTSLDNTTFDNLIGTANTDDAFITVATSVIGTATKTITNCSFTNTGSGAEFNVNRTGADNTGSWNFTGTVGAFGIEAEDGSSGANEADPGMLRWPDSATNSAPNSPTSLLQKKVTGGTTLSTGAWTNETQVEFTATADDPDTSDTLYLCVEKDFLATALSSTNGGDLCGTGVAYSGTPVTVSVTITGLSDASEYHWQAQVKDAATAYSSFVGYGANTENPPTSPAARDFGVDTTAPSGGTAKDGQTSGGDLDWNTDGSLTSLLGNWTGTEPDSSASGLSKYEYALRRGTDYWTPGSPGSWGAGTYWYDNTTSTSFTVNSMNLSTGTTYYFTLRTTDNAGNSATIDSNGIQVTPTLSFTLGSNSVTFSDLNNANNWTDTKTTTLTTSTNAANGYTVKGYVSDYLRSLAYITETIADFAGTWTTPQDWANFCKDDAADCGFGYTSDDTSVQGSNRFLGGTLFAQYTQAAPGEVLADHTDAVNGSTGAVSNEQFTVTHKVSVSQSQPASIYQTILTVICTANF